MINYENTTIERVSVHNVGNKNNGEDVHFSKRELNINDGRIRGLLLKYFLKPFEKCEYYSFTYENDEVTANPVYQAASEIFDNEDTLHDYSIKIAQHLFDLSVHSQIKRGDLFVVYFRDVIVDDEITNAVGIFKSETRHPFLKLENITTSEYSLSYEDGINIDKLDKGCLILDTERKIGMRVCSIDNSNKSEARFWQDSFLQLKPFNDEYYYTSRFMSATKEYVMEQLPEELEVGRVEQIDLLNRSAEYFKKHENFNKKEFENEILRDDALIKSFRNHNQRYMQENDIDFGETFEISPNAVQRQNRIFKSILKLDKNFHVYIHGDSNLIERGIDDNGRKYYKLYFENEN